jgi:transcription initiation factor TFIIE subunit alpha
VKNNASEADKQNTAQSGAGLKVAGSGPGERRQDEGVSVMMSMDKDEYTQKLERDAEAAAKRQQNALPAWHLKSTISGDLTALGIMENARAESAPILAPSTSMSNDNILKGLGVVGAARRTGPIHSTVVEDIKPVINHESDCEFFFSFI